MTVCASQAHFLLTRFDLRSGDADARPPDEEWLTKRADVFSRFTAPSVREQREQSFGWIIFCDVDSSQWLLQLLAQEAPAAERALLPRFSRAAVAEAVCERCRDAERVITTRVCSSSGRSQWWRAAGSTNDAGSPATLALEPSWPR